MNRVIHTSLAILIVLLFLPLVNTAQTETTEKLAIQYYQDKEYEKAVELFEVLYNNNPGPLYYSYYFDCLIQTGDYKRAEKFLNKQIKEV